MISETARGIKPASADEAASVRQPIKRAVRKIRAFEK
jgi:hypothetical protein